MNYRHGYHAGNHTEVFKHAALVMIIGRLLRKNKPFMVLDTHSGAGIHDLRSEMAVKTCEADAGIRRVIKSGEPALEEYLNIVRAVGGPGALRYPGSPEIVRRLLRTGDRLIACEMHPEDAAALRVNMSWDHRVSVHNRDGYEAINAFVPPPQRRGLVFIDPPYERQGEAEMLGESIASGLRKWPTGIFVGWFPIKSPGTAGRVSQPLIRAGMADGALLARFTALQIDGEQLAGGGLIICNPPYETDRLLAGLCRSLQVCYGEQSAWSVDPIAFNEPVRPHGRRLIRKHEDRS